MITLHIKPSTSPNVKVDLLSPFKLQAEKSDQAVQFKVYYRMKVSTINSSNALVQTISLENRRVSWSPECQNTRSYSTPSIQSHPAGINDSQKSHS
jgi:hypothetical protein